MISMMNTRRSAQARCPFCRIVDLHNSGVQSFQIDEGDVEIRILEATDRLLLIPDISPVVPNHLLIVSRKHTSNLFYQDEATQRELDILKSKIREVHNDRLCKETFIFEHGSTTRSYTLGCITHAHTHCVPLELFTIREVLTKTLKILGLPEGEPASSTFLMAEFTQGIPHVWPNANHSQFFRRLIADETGNLRRAVWQACLSEQLIRESRLWVNNVSYTL